jgi:hypothetical protein
MMHQAKIRHRISSGSRRRRLPRTAGGSERRPFFLEGLDLFKTPIQAVYTRTITAPLGGARLTGKDNGFSYTVLAADDAGGGTAILPGPSGSVAF